MHTQTIDLLSIHIYCTIIFQLSMSCTIGAFAYLRYSTILWSQNSNKELNISNVSSDICYLLYCTSHKLYIYVCVCARVSGVVHAYLSCFHLFMFFESLLTVIIVKYFVSTSLSSCLSSCIKEHYIFHLLYGYVNTARMLQGIIYVSRS